MSTCTHIRSVLLAALVSAGCSDALVSSSCALTVAGQLAATYSDGCGVRLFTSKAGGSQEALLSVIVGSQTQQQIDIEVDPAGADWQSADYSPSQLSYWSIDIVENSRTTWRASSCEGCGPSIGTVSVAIDELTIGASNSDGTHAYYAHGAVDAVLPAADRSSGFPDETLHLEF